MKVINVNIKTRRLILVNWSILLIFVMSMLNSCTTPQSINGKNNNHKKIQNYKVNNELENRKLHSNLNINDTALSPTAQYNEINQENAETRIPTLREQMKAMNDRQDRIESKIDALTSQVNQLTNEIQVLKNSKSNSIAQNTIISGEEQVKIDEKNMTLLSDEAETKQQSKIAIITKPTIKNTTPKKIAKNTIQKKSIKKVNNTSQDVNSLNQLENVLSQADNLINQKNYNDAEKILLIQLNNNSKALLADTIKIKLAECYLGNGNSQKAKEIYEELLKTSPKGELTPIAKKMLQQL